MLSGIGDENTLNKLNIKYINLAPENLDQKNEFDIILNLEVVEHVEDLDLYLSLDEGIPSCSLHLSLQL